MARIKPYLLSLCLLLCGVSAYSQQQNDPAYQKVIADRARKIVLPLKLKDSIVARKVGDIISAQYLSLNQIYENRDSKGIQYTDSAIQRLHADYLAKLDVYLSNKEIVKVKDGMTYGVLPITYAAYQDMLPKLTQAQKSQILSWLTEAREKAMDAESSEKKHAMFKKYKGRINNYLSAAGIDMKKEGEAWQQRIKEKAAQSTH